MPQLPEQSRPQASASNSPDDQANAAPDSPRPEALASVDSAGRVRPPRASGALLVIATILIIVLLEQARAVFVPLAAACVLAALIWPIHHWLARRAGLWLAIPASMLLVLSGVAALGGCAWYATDRAVSVLSDPDSPVPRAYERAIEWARGRSLPIRWLPESLDTDDWAGPGGSSADHRRERAAEPDSGSAGSDGLGEKETTRSATPIPMGVVERSVSFVTSGVNLVVGLATTLFLAMAIMVFVLVEVPAFHRRARVRLGDARADQLADAMARISRHTRRYAASKTLGGLIAGTMTGLMAWAIGIPQPLAWGVLSMAMNYIPNIGILISAIPPALLALTLHGPVPAAIFVGGVVVIEGLIGNVFDPLVEGRALRLPSALVLVALVFWVWLWGIAGALLCVPLTAAILTGLEQFPRTRDLARLFRRRSEGTDPES